MMKQSMTLDRRLVWLNFTTATFGLISGGSSLYSTAWDLKPRVASLESQEKIYVLEAGFVYQAQSQGLLSISATNAPDDFYGTVLISNSRDLSASNYQEMRVNHPRGSVSPISHGKYFGYGKAWEGDDLHHAESILFIGKRPPQKVCELMWTN